MLKEVSEDEVGELKVQFEDLESGQPSSKLSYIVCTAETSDDSKTFPNKTIKNTHI